jgi:hypothetical protein
LAQGALRMQPPTQNANKVVIPTPSPNGLRDPIPVGRSKPRIRGPASKREDHSLEAMNKSMPRSCRQRRGSTVATRPLACPALTEAQVRRSAIVHFHAAGARHHASKIWVRAAASAKAGITIVAQTTNMMSASMVLSCTPHSPRVCIAGGCWAVLEYPQTRLRSRRKSLTAP